MGTASTSKISMTKIAIVWNDVDFDVYVNGVKINSQVASSAFSANDLTSFGFSFSNNFHGNIKESRVYMSDITESEAITLTTL